MWPRNVKEKFTTKCNLCYEACVGGDGIVNKNESLSAISALPNTVLCKMIVDLNQFQ